MNNNTNNTEEHIKHLYASIEAPREAFDRALHTAVRPVKTPNQFFHLSVSRIYTVGIPVLAVLFLGSVSGYRLYNNYTLNRLTSVQNFPVQISEDQELEAAIEATDAGVVADTDLLS